MNVKVDADSGFPMPTTKTGAQLQCGDKGTFPGAFEPEDISEKTGQLVFGLDLDIKGATCDKALILDTDSAEVFYANLKNVKFDNPSKNGAVRFPKTGEPPIVMKPSRVLSVSTEKGDACARFDVTSGQCLDDEEAPLLGSKAYVVARVEGRRDDGAGERVSYIVGFGQEGFAATSASRITAAQLNQSLKNQTADFNWYENMSNEALLNHKLDKDWIAGNHHQSFKANLATLAGVRVLGLESVWIHGFQNVEAAKLNGSKSARWFAIIEAKKGGATKMFVVGGAGTNFLSIQRSANGKFFDLDDFIQNQTAGGQVSAWKVYDIKGELGVSGCMAEPAYYTKTLSGLDDTEISENNLQVLGTCEVSKHDFTGVFGATQRDMRSWTMTPTYYQWGWHKISD